MSKHTPERCSETVPTQGLLMHYHCCQKPVTVIRNGKPYCKIHDPEYVKGKLAERMARYEKEWKEKSDNFRLQQVAPELLAALRELVLVAEVGLRNEAGSILGCDEAALKRARAAIENATKP